MRRVRAVVAGVAVAAVTLGVAAPAGAQEEEPATLGFAVNATEGPPGQLVLGKADVADVQEHCTTTVEGLQDRFGELLAGPFAGFATEGELFERIFPDFDGGPLVFDTHDKLAYGFMTLVAAGVADNVGGAAEDALPQTFVVTFADIETQEPVGAPGNFDPDTGEGSVVVPEVEPGLWAVAAACVGPSLDIDTLEAGIRASGDFLEEIGAPAVNPEEPEFEEFMQDFLDSETTGFFLLLEFTTEIGPTLVENIVTPDAFGAVLFCVHNAEGVCPGPPPPPPPGEPPPPPSEEPTPAEPIVAVPAFTG